MQRRPHKVAAGLCAALKLTEKNKLLEVERRARAPVHGLLNYYSIYAIIKESMPSGTCPSAP